MSPRTAASTTSRNAAPTRTTRSSRNSLATELPQENKKAPQPSARRPLKSAIASKKSVTTKRVTRATRTNGNDSADDASDSGTDGDKEDADNDEADEPEVFAPSEIVTRKRGHQTGLSLSLANTTLDAGPRGIKRELSTSTVDGAEARPAKQLKQNMSATSLKADAKDLDEDDEDDDEAYNAVNYISESDENPSDIERVEEQNIIDTVEKNLNTTDEWTGFTLDGVAVDDDSPFFSEHFAVTEPNSEIELMLADNSHENTSPSPNSAPARRVRFADVVSTSSSSALSADSEADDTTFPDLILDQESLRPSARQLFEIDDEAQQHSDESYWEFDSAREMPPPKTKGVKPQEESVDDFSGYETDSSSGQTTDEESVPPLTVHRPHTVLRLNAENPRKKMAPVRRTNPVARASQQNQQQNKQGKGPCMGTWTADPSKPIGVIHPRTKRMVYLTMRVPSLPHPGVRHNHTSSGVSSPPNAYIDMSRKPWPRPTWPGSAAPLRKSSDSDSSNAGGHGLDGAAAAANYMTRSVADVMMQYLPGTDAAGADPFFEAEQALVLEDEEDTDEAQLDIEAFIDFGDQDSDSNDGGGGDTDAAASLAEELAASPVAPLSTQRLPTITPKRSRSRSSSQNLLEHFDKGVVSAFRRNQSRHQAVLRRPSSTTGARVQAIKGGRHVAAATPITPIRKRKAERSMSSSMAPFTGVNTARLRSGTA